MIEYWPPQLARNLVKTTTVSGIWSAPRKTSTELSNKASPFHYILEYPAANFCPEAQTAICTDVEIGHPGSQFDRRAGPAILVKKIELFTPDRLELPERHLPHDLVKVACEGLPNPRITSGIVQRIVEFASSLQYPPDDRRLAASILSQDLTGRRIGPEDARDNLPQ